MSKSFAPVVSPAVVSNVQKRFAATHGKLNKVMATIASERAQAVNQVLDAMTIACDKPKAVFTKGNAATNPAKHQIKAMFDAIVEAGHLEKTTAATYQTCFWIAFDQGCAWSPDLANKKSADKKSASESSESSESSAKTSGKVETTDIPALHKTLSKALAQARILNQSIFAADLVDLIQDTWPDFKETVLSK